MHISDNEIPYVWRRQFHMTEPNPSYLSLSRLYLLESGKKKIAAYPPFSLYILLKQST